MSSEEFREERNRTATKAAIRYASLAVGALPLAYSIATFGGGWRAAAEIAGQGLGLLTQAHDTAPRRTATRPAYDAEGNSIDYAKKISFDHDTVRVRPHQESQFTSWTGRDPGEYQGIHHQTGRPGWGGVSSNAHWRGGGMTHANPTADTTFKGKVI